MKKGKGREGRILGEGEGVREREERREGEVGVIKVEQCQAANLQYITWFILCWHWYWIWYRVWHCSRIVG